MTKQFSFGDHNGHFKLHETYNAQIRMEQFFISSNSNWTFIALNLS